MEKAKILGNVFIDSQFNYLIWTFCRNTFYSKIEKNHHRTLQVIYTIDNSKSNLLLRNDSVSIHQRDLATEMFKSLPLIYPEFMWSFFKQKKVSYNLREGPILNLPRNQYNPYINRYYNVAGLADILLI